MNLGLLAQDAGDLAAAEAAFRQVTRLAPGIPDPWFRLAAIQAATGRRAEALLTAAQLEGIAPALAAELRARLAETP
jgi:Tfp pilus assembly protein PilF